LSVFDLMPKFLKNSSRTASVRCTRALERVGVADSLQTDDLFQLSKPCCGFWQAGYLALRMGAHWEGGYSQWQAA